MALSDSISKLCDRVNKADDENKSLAAELAATRERLAEVEREVRTGNAACRMIADLVALIPIGQTLVASKDSNSLIAYFRELSQRATSAELKASHSLANNICPDHRDKQTGKPCLACTVETLERRAKEREQAANAPMPSNDELACEVSPSELAELRRDRERWRTALKHLGGSIVADKTHTRFGIRLPSVLDVYKNTEFEFRAAIDAALDAVKETP